jgi:hypothetical protein
MSKKHGPQTHRGEDDGKQPSTYEVKRHHGAKPGEWQGELVPVKKIDAAKILKLIQKNA